MRIASFRSAARRPWIPAAAAALALSACGGSEESTDAGAGAQRAPSSAPSAPAADVPALPQHEFNEGVNAPLVAKLDAPPEYEEATEKPLVATFPESSAAPAAAPNVEGLPADDAVLGKPLVINGKVVPFEEVKRHVCLGSLGVAEIESAKVQIFIDEEIARRVAAGTDKSALEVGEEELSGVVKDLEDQIKVEYPEGGVTVEDLFATLATDTPMERLRVQRQFEKLFLPDDPAQYPPVTLEAILGSPGGDGWLEQLKVVYAERQASPDPKKKDLDSRALDEAILQQIVEHLHATSTLETAPAPGVLYRLNGKDITVADIWKRIEPRVTVMEVHAAKQWIVNSTLLEQAFVAAGAWLSPDEADAAYRAHSDPYKDSIFSYERIAVAVKQFPSVDRYKEYRRLYESFQRMKKDEITDEALKKHGEFRTDKIVGQVSVDVDVLLCSAYDLKGMRWKKNGWIDAENRMKDVLQLLVDERQPWEVMVEKYSDFYEPPLPVSAREQEMEPRPDKGRFRNYQRNNLLAELGESEYGLFLNGSSITDFIFYEQEVGTLGTPMRGPLGWYLPRLIRRSKPPRQLPGDEENLKALRLDDYVTWHLNEFTQELIQKNEIYGLELPGTM